MLNLVIGRTMFGEKTNVISSKYLYKIHAMQMLVISVCVNMKT